jgi:putative DNA primase/helicase
LSRGWLPFDLDGVRDGVTFTDLLLWMERYRGFAYTTAKHTTEAPRVRIILQASRDVDRLEGQRACLAIERDMQEEFGSDVAKFDRSVYRAEQPCYTPLVGAQTFRFEGPPVDVGLMLESAPQVVERPDVGKRAETAAASDPILRHLIDNSMVKREIDVGRFAVDCPCADLHTSESGDSSTVYMLPNFGGVKYGKFHCLHSHCEGRDQKEFIKALGLHPGAVWKAQNQQDKQTGESAPTGDPQPDAPGLINPQGNGASGADGATNHPHTDNDAAAASLTEMEIAAAFTLRGTGSLLHVAGMDWYTNTGPRWQRDDKLSRFTLANRLCRSAGSKARDSIRARIETNKTAAAIVNIARPDLIAVPADFDVRPYELNTPKGVIDLRHGTMRRRTPADWFMHSTAVDPDSRGIAGTVFADFLTAITCSDGGLAKFLQSMLGAALFASNALADHWLAFLVGNGRNGKGTLVEKCAARAMGSYARRIPAEVLLADDRGTRHPTEIANLVGARLAYASEIDEGRRWNESRLKELSGGDKLSGRFMRQDLFEFVPSHRLVIYANHRPIIQNPDAAFRARLKLVPFNASFAGQEDTALPERLTGELPRILGWMIAGAADYWEAGQLRDCDAVASASASYFEMHATFDAWLEERCYLEPTLEARAKALYHDFKTWKQDRGEGVPSQTRWGETMATRFARRLSNGVIYCGIGLRP